MGKNSIEKLAGFCVVTGASSGIGLELARCAASDGCALLLVADRDLSEAAAAAQLCGASEVQTLEADLSTSAGVDQLMDKIGHREVAALFANAGQGHGGAFFDQHWDEIAPAIATNVTQTVCLIHRVGAQMVLRDHGRILVTGSIVGNIPGAFNLIYNSTKAFIDDFCVGLAEELKDSNVVVSCLLPGATDTDFFARADMEDTVVGRSDSKADPAEVARDGYRALLNGTTQEVSGLINKVQHTFAGLLPDELLAKMHRYMAQPNS